GSIRDDGKRFHSSSIPAFIDFLKNARYVCGHNIVNHDLLYIKHAIADAGIQESNIIDTLYLSALMFPAKPSHALLKDDKLSPDDANNPLSDAIKARDLFSEEINAFHRLPESLKRIYCLLLNDRKEFGPFFRFIEYKSDVPSPEDFIRNYFKEEICYHADLAQFINTHPVELAYCLALIDDKNRHSISPRWLLKNYPDVERILFLLRNNPCIEGCHYCNQRFDTHRALKRYFDFDSFRTFAGESLQEKAITAAVENKSLLAVYPTCGGKSLTIQLPALMAGEHAKAHTVVISPLQSLMKDQVDNLEKIGITHAVTIN